jgi:hypothetical protein
MQTYEGVFTVSINKAIALMTEAVITVESSVSFYRVQGATSQKTSHFNTLRREILKFNVKCLIISEAPWGRKCDVNSSGST